MTKQVFIGKHGTQPFVINDPNVSRHHATLYIEDNGKLTLVDSSTNGTFIHDGVQFVRIPPHQPVPVRPDSMIRLGPETRFHIYRVLPQTQNAGQPTAGNNAKKEPAKPKKINVGQLRKVSERYQKNKLELEAKLNNYNGMRSFIIVLSVLASAGSAILGNEFGLNQTTTLLVTVGILVVLITTLMLVINSQTRKIKDAIQKNDHDYAVKYCCPECHFSFRGKYYENIIASGKCPNCKTEYYE